MSKGPSSRIYDYSSDEGTVSWDLKRCIHAEECIRSLPAVFDPQRRPWVDPSNAGATALADAVRRCPSGALHFTPSGDAAADAAGETPPEANSLSVAPDGPLYAVGDLRIHLPDGSVLRETRVAFCRCGHSENKPFCDNSHIEAAFSHSGKLAASKLADGEGEPDGSELHVSLDDDGPLMIAGPVTIDGADSPTQSGRGAALCRCGASAGKPYCDGSHESVGFSTG